MESLGFGAMLAQTMLLLAVVGVLAVVTLRLAARYGIGLPGGRAPARKMEVLDRLSVGGRQHVVALRVADRVVVVGQTSGRMQTLTELSRLDWDKGNGFSEVLATTAPVTPFERPTSAPASDEVDTEELVA